MKFENVQMLLLSFIRKNKEDVDKNFRILIANEKEGRVKTSLSRMLDEYYERNNGVSNTVLNASLKKFVFPFYRDISLKDLWLSDTIKKETEAILKEWKLQDILFQNHLAPVNKILLEGPPGNGKTSYAISLAKELGIPFVNLSGSQILDCRLGQSEKNANTIFANLPDKCVLFFDEFDAVASSRAANGNDGSAKAWNSIVTSFLVNMENLPFSVVFMAATNRLDMLDKAIIRRFDMKLYFGSPSAEDKKLYIKKYLQENGLDEKLFSVDEKEIENAVSYSALELIMKKQHKNFVLDNPGTTKQLV